MSPRAWRRRLSRRGLDVSVRRLLPESDDGIVHRWAAFVHAPGRPGDPRFAALVGVGIWENYDRAVQLAVENYEARCADQERELAVLALIN